MVISFFHHPCSVYLSVCDISGKIRAQSWPMGLGPDHKFFIFLIKKNKNNASVMLSKIKSSKQYQLV